MQKSSAPRKAYKARKKFDLNEAIEMDSLKRVKTEAQQEKEESVMRSGVRKIVPTPANKPSPSKQ